MLTPAAGRDPADGDLIEAQTLARQLLGPDPPTVLDVRWRLGGPPGQAEYELGHVPGAVFVDLDEDLAAPPGAGGRHPLPNPGQFERRMRAAGVSDGRAVVVYDARTSMAAARAWWLLRYFGQTRVAVLNGGFAAWTAAGHPAEIAWPNPPRGDFHARSGGLGLIDSAQAAALPRAGVLLDARAPERFRGEAEPIDPVAGHIPGAVNLPAAELLDRDGRFLEAGKLTAVFAAAGARPGMAVGAYCGSGVTAAHEILALRLAGIVGALYPGSWSEWIADSSRPVATGG